MSMRTAVIAATVGVLANTATAQDAAIETSASFVFNGQQIKIDRDNPDSASMVVKFSDGDTGCGASCVVPMQVAEGVATLGEPEVLTFLTDKVAGNTGLLVDARMPQDRAKGYIPGSVNLPHTTLDAGNTYKHDILVALGAQMSDGAYSFTQARALLIYDRGPGTDDAGRLVENLLGSGYPADLISYYRGGMQVWSILGFSIQEDGL